MRAIRLARGLVWTEFDFDELRYFDIAGRVESIRQTIMPPETSIRCALIQRLSSDSRGALIGPMSSNSPARPSAVTLATRSLTCGLSWTIPPEKSVAISPGATVFAAMPRAPSSLA